jgi:hypothetical protein
MTNNILDNSGLLSCIKREGLIAAIIIAMLASAFLYLFSMLKKLQNGLLFGCYAKTGYAREIQNSYQIMGRLTTNLSFTDIYCFTIIAKNQNSVIHLTNNHINIFYTYFANIKHQM